MRSQNAVGLLEELRAVEPVEHGARREHVDRPRLDRQALGSRGDIPNMMSSLGRLQHQHDRVEGDDMVRPHRESD